MGHGRSPYRNAEFSSSVRDTHWGPIGGYSDRRSLWGRATDLELQCLPFSVGTVGAAMPPFLPSDAHYAGRAAED